MAKLSFDRGLVEAFCKMLSGLAPEPSDHLRIEVFEGARFVRATHFSAVDPGAMAKAIIAEEGKGHDIFVHLATVRRDASIRQSAAPGDYEKVLAFATDGSDESIQAGSKFGKAALLSKSADGLDTIFLLTKAQAPAALTGLKDRVEGLAKKFVGQNKLATKTRVPGTVSYPANCGYAPSQPEIVSIVVVPPAAA